MSFRQWLAATFVAPWLLACQPIHAADLNRQVDAYRVAHELNIVGTLDQLTRLRSVAADPAGIAAAADFLRGQLQRRGFEVQLLTDGTGSPPLVFGELKTVGARRTVVFYAHYDGQPVTPSEWSSDPFAPVMRSGASLDRTAEVEWRRAATPLNTEWRLYGRAVSDDKASIVAFLSAFDALEAAHRRPSINIKVAWEGEEEAGSQHLAAMLASARQTLQADAWLIGDGPVHQSRRPMLYFGARGVLGLRLTLYGPVRALHDGHYGNWVPNPAAMAATLLSQLRDDGGRILIPHFEDSVRPLTPDEQQALLQLPSYDEQLEHEFGIGRTEGGETLAASLMRPALNVRGLRAGQVGDASANAIPVSAEISIDFRLVPDQTPAAVRAAVESYLAQLGWTLVDAEPDLAMRRSHARVAQIEWEPGYPALRSDLSSPVARAVIAAAGAAAGQPVAIMPMMGGSVPIYLFDQAFKVPVIGLPIVNHDNNQHAANENLRLQNLWDGIRTYASMMNKLDW